MTGESGASSKILDLFAGPGGWDEGARSLGLVTIGVEWDAAACLTARAAGHARVRADVEQMSTARMVGKVTGLIASPPCQDFSGAGPKRGEAGVRGQLIHQVMRYARDLRPAWIACEQVPEARHVFDGFAHDLSLMGYSALSGVLNAADYGLPQTRQRAFLIASQERDVAWPAPTHARHPDLFGEMQPWVTARDVLGWGGKIDRRQNGAPVVSLDRPFPTVTGAAIGAGVWLFVDDAGERRYFTPEQAGIWQGFPADYPWHGTRKERGQQVGDAVPPPLARAVLCAVTGAAMPALEEVAA